MRDLLLILTRCCSTVGAVEEELSDGQIDQEKITRVRSFCLLLPFKICITKHLNIYTVMTKK